MSDLYQEILLSELKHPQNHGELPHFTHSSSGANASCGDQLSVQLLITDAGVIENIAWRGAGCAISQATMSLLSEHIKGATTSQVQALTDETLSELTGITQIAITRKKCLMLGLVTLREALKI
ncbi:MAG: iron-sulfur cluster assembly scaffold protein [Pseudomonadales bacterium]|nr:iron-sulfur cluster assembly scaffold protein [Candidatus Woesebacteria bacterium]MCB9801526.1 iron-sulfur cluster assembly scaffold protein [Pseudomonadales bacterium]